MLFKSAPSHILGSGDAWPQQPRAEDVERPGGPGSDYPRLTFGLQMPRGIPARSGEKVRLKQRLRVAIGCRTLQSCFKLTGRATSSPITPRSSLTSRALVPANWVLFDGECFGSRPDRAVFKLRHYRLLPLHHRWCITENVVRYESPAFAGFKVGVVGPRRHVDVAAPYAGEHTGFKIAAAAAYSQQSDEGRAVDLCKL
jgi:hypothetical protein